MTTFDIEVVAPNNAERWKTAACFGSCHGFLNNKEHGNPKTVVYRIRKHDDMARKYMSSLMEDIGLKRFFTDEAVQLAVASGEVRYVYKDYYSLLGVMTPFRYFEESPNQVQMYLDLVDAGATPIYAFAAIHYLRDYRGRSIPEGHSCYNSRERVNKQSIAGYLDRLENEDYQSCMKKWCTYEGKSDLFSFISGGTYGRYSLTYESVAKVLLPIKEETPTVTPTPKLVLRTPVYKT